MQQDAHVHTRAHTGLSADAVEGTWAACPHYLAGGQAIEVVDQARLRKVARCKSARGVTAGEEGIRAAGGVMARPLAHVKNLAKHRQQQLHAPAPRPSLDVHTRTQWKQHSRVHTHTHTHTFMHAHRHAHTHARAKTRTQTRTGRAGSLPSYWRSSACVYMRTRAAPLVGAAAGSARGGERAARRRARGASSHDQRDQRTTAHTHPHRTLRRSQTHRHGPTRAQRDRHVA
jgi:hypothetical protein